MASEELKKKKKKNLKNKKKTRKDKWGQPLPPEEPKEEEEEEGVEAEEEIAAAVEEEGEEVKKRNSYENSYEPKKVVVSGMPYSTTEEEIRELFEGVGPIHQLQLSRFPDSGNFSGLAFITFQTEAAVKSSLKLDGKKMGNRFMRVERCRGDPQRKRKAEFLGEPTKMEGCFSAYIGNLSWDVTEDDIRHCFEMSKIASIRFAYDKNTGAFRGFGHIDFEDDESLEEAMKKNKEELHGRPMKLAYSVSSRH
ncbi:putative 33 kDa ribonucleoprotein, chloroplastic [Iris pallida]|uniref:33 kDa ribonucleoprotein, chloroplastic n=1 Tax=Iris pallida TaxID=29817 RepID=A0AAX6EKM1_IRIPA|nr:putative 33 kDa ribonucleoprotein, chloroplastic [Iris pallida]